MHAFATDLVLLDRMLRTVGPDAEGARKLLIAYTTEAIANPARADDTLVSSPDSAGEKLDAIGPALSSILPGGDPERAAQLTDIRQHYHKIVQERWRLIEQSEGSIPPPIILLLVAWLTLISASFGYRAPRNAILVAVFVTAAGFMAGSIYLVLDMNIPFDGPIQISDMPLRRALGEMQE